MDPRRVYLVIEQAATHLSPMEVVDLIDVYAPLVYQYFMDAAKEYARVVAERLKVYIQTPPTARDGVEMCVKAVVETCRRGERRAECLQARLLALRMRERCAELWREALKRSIVKYSQVKPQ